MATGNDIEHAGGVSGLRSGNSVSDLLSAESPASKPAPRRPGIRRLWPAAILAAWIVFSWSWWRECALLLPAATLPHSSIGSWFAQFAPTGEALFDYAYASDDPNRPPTFKGPVEFWSTENGSKTGERFTSEDVVECLANHPRLLTVIRRADRRWIADLASGRLLHPLPDAPPEKRLCYAAGPGRAVYRVGNQLVCFDYEKQETAWTLDRLTILRDVGDRYAVVMPPAGNSSNPNVPDDQFPFVINLTTGQLIPGIERFHRSYFRELSPDGRLVLIQDRTRLRVFDIERNVVAWETDPSVGFPPMNLSFSEDSTELLQAGLNSQGQFKIGRIRIDDGRILAPLPQHAGVRSHEDFPQVHFTRDRRFAFTDRRSRFDVYWHELRARVAGLAKSIGWNYHVEPLLTQKILIDVESGTILGPVSNQGQMHESAQPSPTSDGFLVRDYEHVPINGGFAIRAGDWRVYHLPPARNWVLLAELWLAPIALWGLVRLIASWRRRRRAAG